VALLRRAQRFGNVYVMSSKAVGNIVLLALACAGCQTTADLPLASDKQVNTAAAACSLPKWDWGKVFQFDGGTDTHPGEMAVTFSIAVPPEASEKEQAEAWRKLEKIEQCMASSLERQGVRAKIVPSLETGPYPARSASPAN